MTEVNTSNTGAAGPGVAKKIQAFYTKPDHQGLPVSLWLNVKTKKGTPDMNGLIGDKRVIGYFRQGPKSGFIAFYDEKAGRQADGNYVHVAMGNVVVNEFGIPKLALRRITLNETHWAEVSLSLPVDLQVAGGLNLQLQAERRARHALRKAAQAGAPAGESAVPVQDGEQTQELPEIIF